MTLHEAQVLALKVLKEVMEEKVDASNVQLAQVVPNPQAGIDARGREQPSAVFEILKVEQVKEIMDGMSATSAPTAEAQA